MRPPPLRPPRLDASLSDTMSRAVCAAGAAPAGRFDLWLPSDFSLRCLSFFFSLPPALCPPNVTSVTCLMTYGLSEKSTSQQMTEQLGIDLVCSWRAYIGSVW